MFILLKAGINKLGECGLYFKDYRQHISFLLVITPSRIMKISLLIKSGCQAILDTPESGYKSKYTLFFYAFVSSIKSANIQKKKKKIPAEPADHFKKYQVR